MTSKRLRLRAVARCLLLAACFVATAAGLATPASAKGTLSCAYVEVAPAGPAGNRLEIEGSESVVVAREGEEITVAIGGSSGTRAEPPLTCAGGVPTVTTVDAIVHRATGSPRQLLIDERDGRFEPGATSEPGSDEIEISTRIPAKKGEYPRVYVLGTPGSDFLAGGDLSRGRIGVDLNWGRDTATRDADLKISGPRSTVLQLDGGEGDDRVTAAGGRGFIGPISLRAISLRGGEGDDLLIGRSRRDRIEGEGGDDTLYGRGGPDMIYAGPGRDRAWGQNGADWILGAHVSEDDTQFDRYFGGPGDDYVASRLGGRDEVRCGSGRDEAWVDPFDLWRGHGCDETRVAKTLASP